jgi:hypothetical protein
VSVLAWSNCSLENAIGDTLRFLPGVVASLVFIPAVAQNLGLNLNLYLKESGLNGAGTTHAPQQRCKPEHQRALHGISGR